MYGVYYLLLYLLVHVAPMHTTHVLGMHNSNMLLREYAATHDVYIMCMQHLLPRVVGSLVHTHTVCT
jgi:hypothetical protein